MWYIEVSCRGPVGISRISIGVHIRNFSSVPISDILLPISRGGDVYKACHRASSNNSISSVVINRSWVHNVFSSFCFWWLFTLLDNTNVIDRWSTQELASILLCWRVKQYSQGWWCSNWWRFATQYKHSNIEYYHKLALSSIIVCIQQWKLHNFNNRNGK